MESLKYLLPCFAGKNQKPRRALARGHSEVEARQV